MPETYLKPFVGRLYHLPWIARHISYYLKLNSHILLRGVPLKELLVLKYPFQLADAAQPPLLSIDITDACDLECVYCNNPLFPNPRTMMSEDTFAALLANLDRHHLNRIRIGGGEPTLHPRMHSMLQELAKRTKYLSLVTNGQWKDHRMEQDLLSSGVDLIEISVDAGGAKVYEASRRKANYRLLLYNLKSLRRLRDKTKSKTLIKMRLMLRPSTKHLERQETRFFGHYADCVLPQWLLKHPESDYAEDVFVQESIAEHYIPECVIPFKDLQIRPDGKIPLCPAKGCAIDPQDRIFIGDVKTDDLIEVWNCQMLKDIRAAHRHRQKEKLGICLNCHYG